MYSDFLLLLNNNEKKMVIFTLRIANVLLAHHNAPFENSAFILFFNKTCLKSEIFNSFMKTEL